MGYFGRCVFLTAVSSLLLAVPAAAQIYQPPEGFPEGPFINTNLVKPKKGELIVKLKPQAKKKLIRKFQKKNKGRIPSASQLRRMLAKELGLRLSDPMNGDTYQVKGKRVKQAKVKKAKSRGMVSTVESNYQVWAFAGGDDFLYKLGLLCNLDAASCLFGTGDVDVDAPEAWDITKGDPELVVGVIDTGVTLDHNDLKDNIWTNPLEVANGIDDDGNGFIDDIHGWNFVDKTGDPTDDHFHGTHCAGIIAAAQNNGKGIAGVAPNVKIMGLKMLNAEGKGDTADLVRAIDYAVQLRKQGINIRVLNASLGGGEESETVRSSIKRANDAGIVFVAAAGNNGTDNDKEPVFPASYDLGNVIAVASLDSNGKLSSFSNYGNNNVHVAAPGANIWSSIVFNFYLPFSGTSMAAPHVSGIAALVLSKNPQLSPQQVRNKIINSVKPLPGLEGKMRSPGIVSAYNALK